MLNEQTVTDLSSATPDGFGSAFVQCDVEGDDSGLLHSRIPLGVIGHAPPRILRVSYVQEYVTRQNDEGNTLLHICAK